MAGSLPRLPQRLTVSLETRNKSATSATVIRSGKESMETLLTFLPGLIIGLSCDTVCSSVIWFLCIKRMINLHSVKHRAN